MASAKGGSLPSGVVYGEGCTLPGRLGGMMERRELPQRGRAAPAENGLWRILKATGRSLTKSEETALVSPYCKFRGNCTPVIYVRVRTPYGRKSGWNTGGRMANTEGGSLPTGVGIGRGVPFPAD